MSGIIQKEHLNEQDLLFNRMMKYHIQLVEEINKGNSPLQCSNEGILVVHVIPDECALGRAVYSGSQLKEAAIMLPPLGRNHPGNSKFNVDGLLKFESWNQISTYAQIFRDGHVESVLSNIAWENKRGIDEGESPPKYLTVETCEVALLQFVPAYLDFCETMSIEPSVWCFSSVIDCEHARVGHSHWDDGHNRIDRTPARLPELFIESKSDCKIKLRDWCDSLWQAGGWESSPNFDENGKHHPSRQ